MIGPKTQGQVATTKATARLVEQAKRVTLPLTHSAGRQPTAVRLLKPRTCGNRPDESRHATSAALSLCFVVGWRRRHDVPILHR